MAVTFSSILAAATSAENRLVYSYKRTGASGTEGPIVFAGSNVVVTDPPITSFLDGVAVAAPTTTSTRSIAVRAGMYRITPLFTVTTAQGVAISALTFTWTDASGTSRTSGDVITTDVDCTNLGPVPGASTGVIGVLSGTPWPLVVRVAEGSDMSYTMTSALTTGRVTVEMLAEWLGP
jgi:hypothetical protein